MPTLILTLMLGWTGLSGALFQQGPSQEELKKKLDEKKSEAWTRKSAWIFDYDEARAKAGESKKPIFAYFTRSYAG